MHKCNQDTEAITIYTIQRVKNQVLRKLASNDQTKQI